MVALAPFAPLAIALAAALFPQEPPRPKPRAQNPLPPLPADTEVVTTASGLKYCVLKAGEPGESPRLGDMVKVQYTGWHTDGSSFDSSRPADKPVDFVVGDATEGWNEALQLMRVGAHWKLTLPPELGYGARGNPPLIKPNETLIFELELVGLERGKPLPPFHAGVPARQNRTESGLLFEPVTEGTGSFPKGSDILEFKYAYWNPAGRLLDACEMPGRALLRGSSTTLPLRFMQIAATLVPVGARYRFEVPAELVEGLRWRPPMLPEQSVTIWELELVRVLAEFTRPDPQKCTQTASGLLYEVLKEGTGAQPKEGDTVSVNYAGWFLDGTLFDSNLPRGQAYSARLVSSSLIKGWVEGIPLMKEGATCRFLIPAALGYGDKGFGKIPPKADLVFQIELLKVRAQ